MKTPHPYAKRLNKAKLEFLATLQSLVYVDRFWNSQMIQDAFRVVSYSDVSTALKNVEGTFIVSLYGEYEGILKDHLVANHPNVAFDERKDTVNRLLSLIMKQEALRLNAKHRRKLDSLRDYRNSIAHRSHRFAPPISVAEASTILSVIVSKFAFPK